MLHQCAQEIVQEHGGRFPQNAEALLALPGIGRYTAAAIASIAFAEPVAVVDGNVERVLQRLTGTDLTTPQIWQHAQVASRQLPARRFQSGHDGTRRNRLRAARAACPACPVRKWCATQGVSSTRPYTVTMERRAPQPEESKSGVRSSRRNGNLCVLNQRDGESPPGAAPEEASLMPGMWELPQSSEPPRPMPISAHWRTFRHSITITDYTVHVLRNAAVPDAHGRRQRQMDRD